MRRVSYNRRDATERKSGLVRRLFEVGRMPTDAEAVLSWARVASGANMEDATVAAAGTTVAAAAGSGGLLYFLSRWHTSSSCVIQLRQVKSGHSEWDTGGAGRGTSNTVAEVRRKDVEDGRRAPWWRRLEAGAGNGNLRCKASDKAFSEIPIIKGKDPV